jgi:hypothetical protein
MHGIYSAVILLWPQATARMVYCERQVRQGRKSDLQFKGVGTRAIGCTLCEFVGLKFTVCRFGLDV